MRQSLLYTAARINKSKLNFKVKDHLKVELEKIKGKMRQLDKKELRDIKEYHVE